MADLLEDLILDDEQISSMISRKDQLQDEHTRYLRAHPELKQVLNDFVTDCLLRRPEDVIDHAAHYFKVFKGTHVPPPPESSMLRPIVLCGPSGVGKGTLIARLMKEFADDFRFSVSHTTRPPRDGEVDGVHYHFTDADRFRRGIEQGKFVEHAEVHGNLYGTSVAAVADVTRTGRICILDIDVQGVLSVKKTDLNPRYIFIRPPSMEELERRIRGRGSETEESLARRLETARTEMAYVEQTDLWDIIIENSDLDKAYAELKEVVEDDIRTRRAFLNTTD